MKNKTETFNYGQCLDIASLEKAWFMAQIEYSPNGKRKNRCS